MDKVTFKCFHVIHISCIANDFIEEMVFNELFFVCRVKRMYNQEIRPKTGAPAIFSDEIEADFALYLKHCSLLRIPRTRSQFREDILHFTQYKQLTFPKIGEDGPGQ